MPYYNTEEIERAREIELELSREEKRRRFRNAMTHPIQMSSRGWISPQRINSMI